MQYTLHNCDCLEFMRGMEAGSVDAIISDVPYPDYHAERYQYNPAPILYLGTFKCRQLIFWTSKQDFILDYSAVHIWDKKTGCGSEYERIFERNGQENYKVFRHYFINSTVAASFTGDEYTGHPSQKPLSLMRDLVLKFTKEGDTVFDPFMGTGATGKACMMTGRNFIGCEIDPAYFAIAQRRIKDAAQQPLLEGI